MTSEAQPIEVLLPAPTPAFKSEPEHDGTIAGVWVLTQALRWYNENASDKDAAKYLDAPVSIAGDFLTLAWCEHMRTRGFAYSEVSEKYIDGMRERFKVRMQDAHADEDKPVVNIQERVKSKAMEFVGAFEKKLDAKDPNVNWFEFFSGLGVKPLHVPYMLTEFKDVRKHLEVPDVMDAPEADLNRIANNRQRTRKPKQKSAAVKADKAVKSIKYCAKSDEYKVTSIDPTSIVGAVVLWVFNVKTRAMGVFYADEGGQLSIKGTTVIGYDSIKSYSKTIRKPQAIIDAVMTGTPVKTMKLLHGVAAKAKRLKGRIGKDTLLLKVVR